jgi:DNA-binding NarL/FixJ family response regulator
MSNSIGRRMRHRREQAPRAEVVGGETEGTAVAPLTPKPHAPCAASPQSESDEAAMSKIRVLLADDHVIVRDGLCMLVNAQPDMEVVAQAGTGREAVRLAIASAPDVAVLDVSMPDLGGAEAAEAIVARCPGVRILALTRHSDPSYLRRLLQAGAAGYVLKKSAADALINAIRMVVQGGSYIEPRLAGPLLQRTFGRPLASGKAHGENALSAREEEVLQAIAWGRSNKEIAAELALSIKTVESYKAAAVEKLRLRTRADIVRYAVSRGWLAEDKSPE